MANFQAEQVTAQLRQVLETPDLPTEVRAKLEDVERVASKPLDTDVWIYRGVVFVLGAVVLVTVIGGIQLELVSTAQEVKTIPQAIVSIGSAAIGALAGLLAPSPGNS